MAPKKKSNKKNDDWDADLGYSPDPIAAATQAARDNEDGAQDDSAAAEDEAGAGGGLLAALKKNRGKKAKKGKVVEEVVGGEDPAPETNGVNGDAIAPAGVEVEAKAPVEEDAEDEDIFAGPETKGKNAKGGKGGKLLHTVKAEEDDDDEGEDDGSGKVKSKKEKEKEKKEREKQRKKEQVCWKKSFGQPVDLKLMSLLALRPPRRRLQHLRHHLNRNQPNPNHRLEKPSQSPPP